MGLARRRGVAGCNHRGTMDSEGLDLVLVPCKGNNTGYKHVFMNIVGLHTKKMPSLRKLHAPHVCLHANGPN